MHEINQCDCEAHNGEHHQNKKMNIKKLIMSNIFVVVFLSMFIIDTIFMLTVFPQQFTQNIETRAYRFFSITLFLYVMYLYLTLLFKSPSQTNFESLKAKYPNRIFPQRIIDQFNPHKCEFCNNKSKHIRSSHCSTCKVCVLKRDHHCPWVNKCIGYTNMQFFFTYLIWLMIYGVLFFQGFLKYYNNKKSTLWVLKPFVLLCALFTFVVFIAMINLLVQTFISFVNECFFYETTKTQNIERYYICCKQMNMKEMTLNPYNKGWLFNIECCIGPTLLHFLFPIRKQYKSNINEGDVTFCKAAQSNQYDVIKALSGIKYDTIDKIIENQSIQTSPNTYMEYARAQYSNIKII